MLDARSTTPTLRQFTDFLQHHHLQALTEACLRLAREYGAPLLQRLADLPEA